MTRWIALRRWWPLLLAVLTGALIPRRLVAAPGAAPSAVVVLAGGCYWGVQSVFRHVRGVTGVTAGYAIPAPAAPGGAAPAEAVRLVYDPSRISYRQLLDLFFTIVHDPTQLDRQGPDVGAEYRSVVFVDGEGQRQVVRAYIDSLTSARVFPRPIVTEIATLQSFQVVDESQQDYAVKHPADPYIVINDVPKVEALRRRFPRLFRN
ncbi:MAG: peptide-methionine (S)-S-oxide reductase MsrA [Gemmatimonadales bacterium]